MYSFLGLFFLMFCSVESFKFTNGVTKPLGYFDPLGFAKDKSPSELVKLREAELKHGRWGMISAVAIPTTELVTHEKGIHVLDKVDSTTLTLFIMLAAVAEFRSMLLGWENPFIYPSRYFTMKGDYPAGDLGLNLPVPFIGSNETFMSNAELNHGRLAMIGSLGMIAQELVTNQPIF
jgi:hypothetical protein